MNTFWDVPIIVVDVETTGHDPVHNRVTEIACVVLRGGEIIETFTSLVNPHQFIPPFIAEMTGISNAMVFNAPDPEVVFPKVLELFAMPDAIFVAHNSQFDWKFIQETLKRCGLPQLTNPELCSCKLARRLLPKNTKKNVGSVAQYFNITIKNRHRALGDAEATAMFFMEFLEQIEKEYEIETIEEVLRFQNSRIAATKVTATVIHRVQPFLDALPDEAGVYKMFGSDGDLLYIGKAKSLRDRVRSYFQAGAQLPPKIGKMVRFVYSITWVETGSELSALTLESKEIKIHKPPFNTASKKTRRYPFLRLDVQDTFPRLEWCNTIDPEGGAEYFGPFRSGGMAREIAETIQKSFQLRLCREPIVPSESFRPCFYHQIKRCAAPCAMLQTHGEYQDEVSKVRRFLSGYSDGIIPHLEVEMMEAAENLDFETAIYLRNRIGELRRLFDRGREVSTSVNANNVILVIPASERDKTLEVFLIHRGRLNFQQTIGRKADLSMIENQILTTYFTQTDEPLEYSREEINEIQIITSWMYRNRDNGTFIYVESKPDIEIIQEVTRAVRMAFVPVEENVAQFSSEEL
ncbi:MAG: DEDD exonuclease domain-containing protein [Ignavibacteria bacterium]|nr:DEDD exonuclease domain-containing protein [Ignavibacteria bacterium]